MLTDSMKAIWNNWLKQSVFLYSVLYTVATIFNSMLYLINGYYEDPNGNWHELDRAIIVLIVVLAFTMMKCLKVKKYYLKAVIVYVPTLLLAFAYVWVVGLRDTLASSAYRDIFINYTVGFVIASLIGWIVSRVKNKKTTSV